MAQTLQLKVSLDGVSPEIWRRFLVLDTISFEQLHWIIQVVMGWEDYHMYEFLVKGEKLAPDEGGFNPAEVHFRKLHQSPEFKRLLEKSAAQGGAIDPAEMNRIIGQVERDEPESKFHLNTRIGEVLTSEGESFNYEYDFGDCWQHTLIVEKIAPADESIVYAKCVDGDRACPPEDCGGVVGYEEILKIKKEKNHPLYKKRIVGWLGEEFDPEQFDREAINVDLVDEIDDKLTEKLDVMIERFVEDTFSGVWFESKESLKGLSKRDMARKIYRKGANDFINFFMEKTMERPGGHGFLEEGESKDKKGV
ncbi:MAG: plasmid pRiA4b ORF-3 family protein [Candidatus Nanoarchaeia archaeon]